MLLNFKDFPLVTAIVLSSCLPKWPTSLQEHDIYMNVFLDIDECQSSPYCNCQHSKNEICVNTEGSCKCECAEGFPLNGRECVGK